MSLPEKKKSKLTHFIQEYLRRDICHIREMAPGVPYSMLYTKILEREKMKACILNDQNFDQAMIIHFCLKRELIWWLNNIELKNPIRSHIYRVEIFSDASPTD